MNNSKKGMLFTLDAESKEYLRNLAEKNSSSMSYEVRRLIKDEQKRKEQTDRRSIGKD